MMTEIIKVDENQKAEFDNLFKEFMENYANTERGIDHLERYKIARQQGKSNFDEIAKELNNREDVTDAVLLKLLPYNNNSNNRKRGAWTHVCPAVISDIKKWFESKKWVKAGQWQKVSELIWEFIDKTIKNPDKIEKACKYFSESPYSKGFQAGMLTPIINALKPNEFIIVNAKSIKAINHFAGTNFSQKLIEYPKANATGKKLINQLIAEQRLLTTSRDNNQDLFDMFSHWLTTEKNYSFSKAQYWKIAPGEKAWNWPKCRDNEYIAIGWEDLGDISSLSRNEFKRRRDQLVKKYEDWKTNAVDQVWKFAQIKKGDYIVANRGKSEVIGIGIVTGNYYFVKGEEHGHRLPVEWNDTTPRKVDKPGWFRTLIQLKPDKFDEICQAPPVPSTSEKPKVHPECSFTQKTVELLKQLHSDPSYEFYSSNKEDLFKHIVEPFKQLMLYTKTLLPAAILDKMETEKNLFSRINKQFAKQGCWDFYWGAFYPKGGKRTEDAQLFLVIDKEYLQFGFYIGVYGSHQRNRFIRNWRKNQGALIEALKESFNQSGITFGDPDTVDSEKEAADNSITTFSAWIQDPTKLGIRAGTQIPIKAVMKHSLNQLAQKISEVYQLVYPFVILAVSDDPMPVIGRYLMPEKEVELNPTYSLNQISKAINIDISLLMRWTKSLERKGQAIIYGPPGTGKTYLAEHLARHLIGGSDGIYEILQFHPSYAYEDFIQGIRPQTNEDGQLSYPVISGRFLDFCETANECEGKCVLIIDEINRANLSRVFGELMYLLEYRNKDVPLAGGGLFRIPSNIRIIGTMNTADRSIALVDHALRRRFAFLALYPDFSILRKFFKEKSYKVEPLVNVLKNLNQQIGNKHYEIGITFFLHDDLSVHLEDIWKMEIEPYLEEYFFDQSDQVDKFRWEKVKDKISQ